MRIRRAHEGEAVALSGIALESKSHWRYSKAQLSAWAEDLTVSADEISADVACVAEDGAGVIGFFVLAPSARIWSLEHFWVRPACMGQGVGKALLASAADLAARGGAEGVAIDADPHAERFYLACGAKRVGSVAAPIEGEPERVRPQLVLPLGDRAR